METDASGCFTANVCICFSRQFGFFKLNAPENAKKKALVLKVSLTPKKNFQHKHNSSSSSYAASDSRFQAIKYLEQMLIEAEARKLLSEQEKPKENVEEGKNKDDSMEIDDAEPIKTDDEDAEMKELEDKPPEEPPSKKDESDEQPIDIDPKTYCKLGHFHLLLEDYAKGKRHLFLSEYSMLIRFLSFFSPVCVPKVQESSSRSLERHAVSVRPGNCLPTFQCCALVSSRF